MSKFDDAIRDLLQKREKTMKKACLMVEAEAKLRSPVDTGHLRRSITHEVESDNEKTVGRVGTNVEYAIWVEKGTSKTPAQPFLIPSVEENQDKIQDIFRKELEV